MDTKNHTVTIPLEDYQGLVSDATKPVLDTKDAAIVVCAFTALLQALPPQATADLNKLVLENVSEDMRKSFMTIAENHADLLQSMARTLRAGI